MEPVVLTPVSKKHGIWELSADELAVHMQRKDGTETLQIPRSDLAEKLEIVSLLGSQAVLVVRQDGKKLQFQLPPETRKIMEAVIGPPTQASLRAALRRRYAFTAPIAIIFVLAALPLPGDETVGVDAIPFNPVSLILGFGLLGLWLLARVAPRPYLFAADSVWFALLALSALWDIWRGWSSVWWLIWVGFLIILIPQGIKQYRQFRRVGADT